MNRYLVVLLSLLGLGGCAVSTTVANRAPLVQILDMQTGAFATRPALAQVDGELAVLYSTKDDRVVLQIGNQPKQLIDSTARVNKGGSFFKLWPSEKMLHAGWWSHQQGKNVYLTSSADGGKTFAPVSMVNDANDVLPPFTLMRGPQDVLGMTYQDERSPGFQVYFNRSADNGLNWNRPDVRLDTPTVGRTSTVHEPQTIVAGLNWVSLWTDSVQSPGKTTYRIISRRSLDAGVTWTAPSAIASTDHHISALIARADGQSVVVVADELNQGIFALTSSDAGASWQTTGLLAGTSGLSNSGIDLGYHNGRASMVWMAQRSEEKVRIMAASLDVTKREWVGGVKRLDPKTHDNTTSTSPVILTTNQAALVATWVDYRDIRPNVYLATSYDLGTSWSPPRPLIKPGQISAGWPQLVQVGGKAVIAYELYPTEKVADGQFRTQVLPIEEGDLAMVNLSTFATTSEAARADKLTSRVNALWAARVAGKYDDAYEMFDFAYKAATPKSVYLQNTGVITYLAYGIEQMNIAGNEANVNMKLRYEVRPTMMPSTGKPISVPAVDVETPTRWVWVENDWYLVYTPSFEPPVLKY